MDINSFLSRAWSQYTRVAPDSLSIHEWLEARGERIVNDHIAFRTFNLPGISRLDLGRIFEKWGYTLVEECLDFPEKKLLANYWLPPHAMLPKIFISELLLEKTSAELRSWIQAIAKPRFAAGQRLSAENLLAPLWDPIEYADYQCFYRESEYAVWTAAFGLQINHFTVLTNSLTSFPSLAELNFFLQNKGIELNAAGGVIKGSPQEFLEQSSTLAKKIPWNFADAKEQPIMGCYYEFARRYALPDGQLFQGFVPKSADKIFESTYEKKT